MSDGGNCPDCEEQAGVIVGLRNHLGFVLDREADTQRHHNAKIEAQAAEIERLTFELAVASEPSPYCPICGSCGIAGCCGPKRCLYPTTDQDDQIETQAAEIEKLREALEAVWKEATTMRNASKLVGPYPTQPEKNRLWARSMYHAGKRIMEMLKPFRAALGETK